MNILGNGKEKERRRGEGRWKKKRRRKMVCLRQKPKAGSESRLVETFWLQL